MALTSFGGFVLPITKLDSYQITGTFADATQPIDEGDGLMLTPGTGPMFLERAEIAVTFAITPAYLSQQSYVDVSYGGVETAIMDFSANVLNVGIQTLIDTMPANTRVFRTSGVTVVTRSCLATAASAYTVTRMDAPIAEIAMTFLVQDPYWLLDDGVTKRRMV